MIQISNYTHDPYAGSALYQPISSGLSPGAPASALVEFGAGYGAQPYANYEPSGAGQSFASLVDYEAARYSASDAQSSSASTAAVREDASYTSTEREVAVYHDSQLEALPSQNVSNETQSPSNAESVGQGAMPQNSSRLISDGKKTDASTGKVSVSPQLDRMPGAVAGHAASGAELRNGKILANAHQKVSANEGEMQKTAKQTSRVRTQEGLSQDNATAHVASRGLPTKAETQQAQLASAAGQASEGLGVDAKKGKVSLSGLQHRLEREDSQGAGAAKGGKVLAMAGLAAEASQIRQPRAQELRQRTSLQEGESRSEGSKNLSKREQRMRIEVIDQRARSQTQGAETAAGVRQPEGSVAEMAVHLRGDGASAELGQGVARNVSAANPSAGSMSDHLAKDLREVYNTDIVRQAQIILKNDTTGLIRMTLHPETLGNVKIKLNLTDNKIAGTIVVESDEALKAFAKEMKSLEQAFLDGGFDGASLDLSVDPDASGNDGRQQQNGGDKTPFFSHSFAANGYDDASLDISEFQDMLSEISVNVLV